MTALLCPTKQAPAASSGTRDTGRSGSSALHASYQPEHPPKSPPSISAFHGSMGNVRSTFVPHVEANTTLMIADKPSGYPARSAHNQTPSGTTEGQ